MIRRISLIILLIVALSNLEVSFFNNYAFAEQPGQSCTAPTKQLTITTPGISLYRWMVDGSESEQFKVVWVH